MHGGSLIVTRVCCQGAIITVKRTILSWILWLSVLVLFSCSNRVSGNEAAYSCEAFPFERNGFALHLDRVTEKNTDAARQILLIHGSTFSSHEFDIQYKDYSLVQRLAREGYAVWRLDIAGYGRSEPVTDGFMPDTAYAADDIHAAVEEIVRISGQELYKIISGCLFFSENSTSVDIYEVIREEFGCQRRQNSTIWT